MQKIFRRTILALSVLFVMLTTVAFSALSTSLAITTDVVFRPISDIRVDNIVLSGSTVGEAVLQYESEYNVDTITSGFVLPKSNSSITYKVTIANNGDYDQTIYNMTTSSNIGVNAVIKYGDGSTFNYKDIISKKSSVDLYITYTTSNPSNSVINVVNTFDFRKVYKIVYDENGGSSVSDQYKYEGENLVLNLVNDVLEEPSKTGYVFQGWTDESNGTRVKYNKGYTLTVDLDSTPIYTLYALYTKDIYTITFNPDNGESNIVRNIEYNLAYGELPEVSKTGYTLDGWYNSNDEEVTSATLATKNDTITAHWTANEYEITLDKNGGTNNPTGSITATYDSSDLEPARIILPERIYTISGFGLSNSRKSDGATVSGTDNLTVSYTFSGWYTQRSNGVLLMDTSETPTLISDVNEYTDEESNWVHDEDITLYARFSGDGSVTLPTIEKTGYTCGWTANESGTTIQHESGATLTNVIADVPLYGVCVDVQAPTLSLDKITYKTNDFNDWTLSSNSSIDSNGVLTLGTDGNNATATSDYIDVNGDFWYMTFDGYTETARPNLTIGGVSWGIYYYDEDYVTTTANTGDIYNGFAVSIPLSTWQNEIYWNNSKNNLDLWKNQGRYGENVKYIKIKYETGTNYSKSPVKIRNLKIYGQMENSFYLINVASSDNVGVTETKYEKGVQTASYFASNGRLVSNNQIRVTENGTYTVYVKDAAGNETVQTIQITNIKNEATFLPGQQFNAKIKQLAGNTNATYETVDTNITSIERANALPNGFTPTSANIVSTSDSIVPIYAWYNSGTIY